MRRFPSLIKCVVLLVVNDLVVGQLQNKKELEPITYPDEYSIHRPHNYYRQSPPSQYMPWYHGPHHHNHHHRPEVSQYEDEEETPQANPLEDRSANNLTLGIPVDFARNLNKFSVNDLLLNYVEDDEKISPLFSSRFGSDEDDERKAGKLPLGAACMPELQTVDMSQNDDPSILIVPQCTRIERCGGCCMHNLLSCQPTKVENVAYSVIKTKYVGGPKLKMHSRQTVTLERHLNCTCACKVQEKDCNPYQDYKARECRCICKNLDEEKKCQKENRTKLWDPKTCSCRCREQSTCTTGYSYDQTTCRCVLATNKRRTATTNNDPSFYSDYN